jgi:hypothetical protein
MCFVCVRFCIYRTSAAEVVCSPERKNMGTARTHTATPTQTYVRCCTAAGFRGRKQQRRLVALVAVAPMQASRHCRSSRRKGKAAKAAAGEGRCQPQRRRRAAATAAAAEDELHWSVCIRFSSCSETIRRTETTEIGEQQHYCQY